MRKNMFRILQALAVAFVIATVSGVACAQIINMGVPDSFTTNYYSNNTTPGAPAGTLRFSNDGASILLGPTPGTLCANIYVFAADQQLTECCSCPVTANGLVEENIKTNLLANPLTGKIPNSGVIQIVATVDTGVCDPTGVFASGLAPGLTAWTTHIENKIGATFPVSVTENSDSPLSASELADLTTDCSFVIAFGSGAGTCSCNAEAVK